MLCGIACHLLVERKRPLAVVVVLGFACGQVAGVLAHAHYKFQNLGSIFIDFHAESLGKGLGHSITFYIGVGRSLVAARGVAHGLAPVVLGLVVEKTD